MGQELTRWLRFFTAGEHLDPQALPDWMQTEEMQQAMSTLNTFSDKEREYHAYQARMNYLRQQRSIQRHLDELAARAEQARAAEEQARAAAEQARAAEEQARAAAEQARAGEEQARAAEEQARLAAAAAARERDLAREQAAAVAAENERLRQLLAAVKSGGQGA